MRARRAPAQGGGARRTRRRESRARRAGTEPEKVIRPLAPGDQIAARSCWRANVLGTCGRRALGCATRKFGTCLEKIKRARRAQTLCCRRWSGASREFDTVASWRRSAMRPGPAGSGDAVEHVVLPALFGLISAVMVWCSTAKGDHRWRRGAELDGQMLDAEKVRAAVAAAAAIERRPCSTRSVATAWRCLEEHLIGPRVEIRRGRHHYRHHGEAEQQHAGIGLHRVRPGSRGNRAAQHRCAHQPRRRQ